MAIPMYGLYEGGILMASIMSRMRRPAAESDADASAAQTGEKTD
jgi:Sec-independent protein secretion pathway component TatC